MGRVNIEGLGVVDIEGDTPNEQEIEVFKRIVNAKGAEALIEGPAEEETDKFMNSVSFGRIATEVGLAIGGSIVTGGLALPGLALRAGMLARPFLTQLAKSSIGAGVGGGTGAAVSQTFDPKEDVVKEIMRAATEGALGEAIGAPIVIKGGQIVSKLLNSRTPKEFNSLLEGAADAEKALKLKANEVLKAEKVLLDPKASKTDLIKANKIFEKVKTNKAKQELIDSANEIVEAGLTPGIKSSNRTLEIIENIAQKSLIGGGAISRRYEAAGKIGNEIAKDVLDEFKVTANEADLGRLFFESLGGAQGAFIKTKDKMYQAVDDILLKSKLNTARIVPVEDPLRKAMAEVEEIYSEASIPGVLRDTMDKIKFNIGNRQGKYTFSELQKLRQQLVENRFELGGVPTNLRAVDKILKQVDGLFKSPGVPQEAANALKDANAFFKSGQNVFNRGIIRTILKNSVDGAVDGKDAKALQMVYKSVANGDNVKSTQSLFREIDALTGATVKKSDGFKELPGVIRPGTKEGLITKAQAEELKQSFRGQYITNALRASEDSGQFGSIYNAQKFSKELAKGEEKVKDFLFKGENATKLDNLINTLNFAQGDLSRLTGLPGGIFIQMKQAGAAGSVLQMVSPATVTGGQLGAAGLAAGFLGAIPAITILAAPYVATKILLSPRFNSLMFKEPMKAIIKATNMSKEEFLSLSTLEQKRILADDVVQNKISRSMNTIYRNIVGQLSTDGLITKEERDDNLAKIDEFQAGEALVQEANKVARADIPLPNVTPSNMPIIPQGAGGEGASLTPEAAQALAGGSIDEALAANRQQFNTGGIVSAKKSF
jgi:hypothetical protein